MKIAQFITAVLALCLCLALAVAQTVLTHSAVVFVVFSFIALVMGLLVKFSWHELKSEEEEV